MPKHHRLYNGTRLYVNNNAQATVLKFGFTTLVLLKIRLYNISTTQIRPECSATFHATGEGVASSMPRAYV